MFKKKLFLFLIILSFVPVLITIAAEGGVNYDPFSQAENLAGQLDLPAQATSANTTPQNIIVNSIRYLLTFVGLVLVVSILYAGYQWMTSGGEAEKIDKAKSRLKYSIFGLLIILFGYAIVVFVNKVITVAPRQDVITDCETNDDCLRRFGPTYSCSNEGNCLFNGTVNVDDPLNGAGDYWNDKLNN